MATKSDVLGKLKEQITCPICQDQFTNPKILPCFHSFCLDCIERFPTEIVDGSYCRSCPLCRCSAPDPNKGLAKLPPSFVINNLIEVYDLMKKVTGDPDNAVFCDNCSTSENKTDAHQYCKQCAKFFCQQCLDRVHHNWKPNNGHQIISTEEVASGTAHLLLIADKPVEKAFSCSYHHNEPVKVFCETCDELICQLCTMIDCIPKNHKLEAINDSIYSKHYNEIDELSLQPMDQEINRLTKAKAILNSRMSEVTQQDEAAKKDIDEMIAELKAFLNDAGGKLKNNVNLLSKVKFAVLEEQLKSVDKDLAMLTDCRNHVDQLLKIGTPHQMLKAKARVMNRSNSIISSTESKIVDPQVQADIELVKEDIELVKKNIDHSIFENFANLNIPLTFLATFDTVYSNGPLVGQMSNVSLCFSSPRDGSSVPVPSSLFKCHLTPPSDDPHGQAMECLVKESSQPGQYDVAFTPVTRGYHQLHVVMQDGEVHVPGSPMGIMVTIPPEMMTKPFNIIPDELKDPRGIAVSEDGVVMVVSESEGHCITILDNKGVKKISCKGNERGQLKHPRGVAITSGRTIIVADKGNHRIQELTFEGECKSCVGSKGNGHLELKRPHGLFIDRTTQNIFIADHGNNRVVVLDHCFVFVRSFGSESLHRPQDVTVDSNGFVYVVDEKNRVHKFTIEGLSVCSFNCNAVADRCGILSGVTVNNNNLLYVNRKDGCIAVLTTDGKFKGFINKVPSSSQSCKFQSLCYCEHSGYLYVLDSTVVKIY